MHFAVCLCSGAGAIAVAVVVDPSCSGAMAVVADPSCSGAGAQSAKKPRERSLRRYKLMIGNGFSASRDKTDHDQ